MGIRPRTGVGALSECRNNDAAVARMWANLPAMLVSDMIRASRASQAAHPHLYLEGGSNVLFTVICP